MDERTFQTTVLDASHAKPVLVDFWAEWCGPCRVLGPILEELAAEQRERWTLVKVDTEASPDLSVRYRIRSIPNVKLFHAGEVVAEFAGALPKFQIERWLDQHLPDPRLGELEQILEIDAGRLPLLQSFVEKHPDLPAARLALARDLVFADPEQVEPVLSESRFNAQEYDTAQELRTLAEFMTADFDDSPAGQSLTRAREALHGGNHETAVQEVIHAVMRDKNYRDELPRRTAIALFRHFGERSELTAKYRRQFDMALY